MLLGRWMNVGWTSGRCPTQRWLERSTDIASMFALSISICRRVSLIKPPNRVWGKGRVVGWVQETLPSLQRYTEERGVGLGRGWLLTGRVQSLGDAGKG